MNKQHDRPQESLDTVFAILANKYRRRLLVALEEYTPQNGEYPQVPVDAVVQSNDIGTDREKIKISMFHSHLPKLEAHGIIEWDRDTNAVRKGPHFDEVHPLLALMRDHADEFPGELTEEWW